MVNGSRLRADVKGAAGSEWILFASLVAVVVTVWVWTH